MPYIEKWTYSGDYAEREMYSLTKNQIEYYERKKRTPKDKSKLTLEYQKRTNWKNAEKKLKRLMNCNFTKRDIFATFTFVEKLSEEIAIQEFKKFISRLRYYFKKNKLKLKYIYCIGEHKKEGIHFHMIMNNIKLDDLRLVWENSRYGGRLHISTLRFENQNGLGGLARYFMDNTLGRDKEHSNLDEFNKMLLRKWNSSKGLISPKIKIKIIKSLSIRSIPKDYRNYKVTNYETYWTSYGQYQYIELIKVNKLRN